MDKAIAMKWVKALRSGKYEQGKMALKRDNKFCCLGVLCEITGHSNEGMYVLDSDFFDSLGMNSQHGGMIHLKQAVDPGEPSLSSLNDNGWAPDNVEALNFDEIADIIQINYKEL